MSEEQKETMSLSDLGLVEEPTPAEIASVEQPKVDDNIPRIVVDNKSQNAIEVKKVDIDMSKYSTGPKRAIPRPDNIQAINSTDANEGYTSLNIQDIAKTDSRTKPEDAAKKTFADLAQKVDAGIAKTKNSLTAPGGRIDEGKRKYVDTRYETLMERAKKSPNLMKKIKAFQDLMDSDPAFDGADDYEKKGYILFKVAKDTSIGIDDKSFGLAQESIRGYRQTSAEASKQMQKISNKTTDYGDDDLLVLDSQDDDIPIKQTVTKTEEGTSMEPKNDIEEKQSVDIEIPQNQDEEDEFEETQVVPEDNIEKELITLKAKDTDDEFDEDKKEKEKPTISKEDQDIADDAKKYGITVEKYKQIQKEFIQQTQNVLNLTVSSRDNTIYSDYSTANKTLSVSEALRIAKRARPQHLNERWVLQYSGVPIRMSSFSGEELVQFLRELDNPYSRSAQIPPLDMLTSIWGALYNHLEMENKPTFNHWLRKISPNDFPNLLFAIYLALFKDTNYLTFRCPQKGCAKLYLEKHDVMKMIKYPNKKIEDRIHAILSGNEVEPLIYKTPPVPINDVFAISFMTPTVYASLFEQSTMSSRYRDEHTLANIMPYIDKFYVIDKARNQFLPIDFGIINNDLEKTVKRKVKIIERIFESFTLDQRNLAMNEISKVAINTENDTIEFRMPESKCPVCGHVIPEEETTAFTLLFTRAQLSTNIASIPE